MNWGAGSGLGPLTVFAYLLFLAGAALMWRSRDDFSVWFHDELSFFRRNFSRYTPAGPFYTLREESRLKAIPVSSWDPSRDFLAAASTALPFFSFSAFFFSFSIS